MVDLDTRAQKAVDVASTYIQVLIGLASGIITAVLAFYPNIIATPEFDLGNLKYALIILGISVIFGLIGLGGLINATASSNNKTPTNATSTRIPVLLQLITFGVGIMYLVIFVIPG